MDLTDFIFVEDGYTLDFDLEGLVAHMLRHLVNYSTTRGNLSHF